MNYKRLLAWTSPLVFFAFSQWPLYGYTTSQTASFPADTELTGEGVIQMNVELRRRSDHAPAESIEWNQVQLPAQWILADSYMVLHSTITTAGGGIMIYTNNAKPDAAPRATGLYAGGLVDHQNPAHVLPVAWAIVDSTATSSLSASPPSGVPQPGDPMDKPRFANWSGLKDPGTVAVWDPAKPDPFVQAYGKLIPGERYATVKTAYGITRTHFAFDPFVPAVSPDFIFLEANFSSAVTPNKYSTRIFIEAFRE